MKRINQMIQKNFEKLELPSHEAMSEFTCDSHPQYQRFEYLYNEPCLARLSRELDCYQVPESNLKGRFRAF